MSEWLFWAIAAAFAIGSLGLVFAPLLRGAGAPDRRASYDMQVFRDQLREIDADRARGVLSDAEAAATRTEVSRRLLAAAEAEAEEAAGPAPAHRLPRWTAPAGLAAALAVAAGLYLSLGAPTMPDDPLQARLARDAAVRANRPSQAEVEAMVTARGLAPPSTARPEDEALIAQLREVLGARPDDLEGHRLLARSLAATGRWSEARVAQERVVDLVGDAAAAQDFVDLAELRVMAANGYVSPEAEEALMRALTLDPANPVGRYYSGLALLQAGRPDMAYRVWSRLLAEGPPDAPWIAPIEAEIGEVARLAGLPPPAASSPSGPAAADVEAAEALTPAERQTMIEGMVSQLAERLSSAGGPPEDWAQLVRSLGVLGRRDEAAAILAEARETHADDSAALAALDAAARDAGLE
jgi:cytochrome c-type biogenesis protein CcmH